VLPRQKINYPLVIFKPCVCLTDDIDAAIDAIGGVTYSLELTSYA